MSTSDYMSIKSFESFIMVKNLVRYINETAIAEAKGPILPPALIGITESLESEFVSITKECVISEDPNFSIDITPLMKEIFEWSNKANDPLLSIAFILPAEAVLAPEGFTKSSNFSSRRDEFDDSYGDLHKKNVLVIYYLDKNNSKTIFQEYRVTGDGWEFDYPTVENIDKKEADELSPNWSWISVALSNLYIELDS